MPSSTCWASLSAETPGRTSVSTAASAASRVGVEPPLRSGPGRSTAPSARASSAAAAWRLPGP
ncbi:hypothetical protein [Pseudonocardia humida]|uniref:hypothetical protein n=1 Tax=Pseudonocardia humida TaxID=2800819 RepID=UPI00207D64C2|nr:hypothetical protein [Pseudonocardia humida]